MAQMAESSSIHAHVLKMIEWIKKLVVLKVGLLVEMSSGLILQSLINSFFYFIINFNMNKI